MSIASLTIFFHTTEFIDFYFLYSILSMIKSKLYRPKVGRNKKHNGTLTNV
jgi:hypothetical protein